MSDNPATVPDLMGKLDAAYIRIADLEAENQQLEEDRLLDMDQGYYRKLEARITELEAMGTSESARLSQLLVTERERITDLETDLSDCAKTCGGLEYRLEEKAEAELGSLKARRCWTCGNLDTEDGRCDSFSDVFREYMKEKDGECSCTLWEALP